MMSSSDRHQRLRQDSRETARGIEEGGSLPRRREICANSRRRYPVSERHQYVYHLMQGGTIVDAGRYIEQYDLTPEEIAGLDKLLRDIAARREAKEREPAHPPDPYWSLWGRLKARHDRHKAVRDRADRLYEDGVRFLDTLAGEIIEREQETLRLLPALCLPIRGTEVGYDGEALLIAGRRKPVKNDRHAVNALRKLDTDDAYYRQTLCG